MTDVGGWVIPKESKVTNEVVEVLKEACQSLVGAKYEAFSLLGTQIVAGKNFIIIAKVTPIVPNSKTNLQIIKLFKPVIEKAEILEITPIEWKY